MKAHRYNMSGHRGSGRQTGVGGQGTNSDYKMNKFWGNVQHGDLLNNAVFYIWKLLKVDFKSSYHNKKSF